MDAFATLHSCRTEDFPLEGWTWGFPSLCPKDAPPPDVSQHEADMMDISTDRRRRIDRVLVPHNFVSVLRECYPCFLASSDHKAVVFSLLSASCDQQRRKRRPVSFLQSQGTVDDIQAHLSSLQTTGFAQWADSQDLIRRQALAYERTHCCTGYTKYKFY